MLAEVPIDIDAPERLWRAPAGLARADAVFGDAVRLVGYTLDPAVPVAGETLVVHLAWQAVAEMDESYRVFVHFGGEDGRVVAQSDGEPVEWTRPTTGWAVGQPGTIWMRSSTIGAISVTCSVSRRKSSR